MTERMTPDEARALLDGTTPGPWIPSGSGYIGSAAGVMIHDGHVLGDTDADTCLIAAAPALAAMVAGMREEWGIVATYMGREVEEWGFDTRDGAEAVGTTLGVGYRIVRRYVTNEEEA